MYLISVKTFLSILKQASRFFFVKRNLVKDTKKHSKFTVVEGFGNEFLRTSYVLLQEECEDRSLFSLYTSQMTDKQSRKNTSSRLVEEEENEKYFGPPTLS